jgi:WD40 repeat protein
VLLAALRTSQGTPINSKSGSKASLMAKSSNVFQFLVSKSQRSNSKKQKLIPPSVVIQNKCSVELRCSGGHDKRLPGWPMTVFNSIEIIRLRYSVNKFQTISTFNFLAPRAGGAFDPHARIVENYLAQGFPHQHVRMTLDWILLDGFFRVKNFSFGDVGSCGQVLKAHTDSVHALAISHDPEQRYFASGGGDVVIRLWDGEFPSQSKSSYSFFITASNSCISLLYWSLSTQHTRQ